MDSSRRPGPGTPGIEYPTPPTIATINEISEPDSLSDVASVSSWLGSLSTLPRAESPIPPPVVTSSENFQRSSSHTFSSPPYLLSPLRVKSLIQVPPPQVISVVGEDTGSPGSQILQRVEPGTPPPITAPGKLLQGDPVELVRRCRASLLEITAWDTAKRRLLELTGDDAQVMSDFLGKLLDNPGVSQRERSRLLHLLSKLAKSAQPVAEGGYGYIYKASYNGNTICVKAVRLAQRNSSQTLRAHAGELILWAHLSHGNILPFRGIYLSNEQVPRVCIVSPWMDNGDLLQYLRDFPDSPRLPLLHDVISGLQYLHQYDIVHADLKAKNVLVSSTNRAMLADFGISKILMTLPGTVTNVTAGTAYWMAPELFLDEKPFPNRESDMWAFGCISKTPFYQYETVPQLIRAFLNGGVLPLEPASDSKWGELKEKIWPLAKQCWDYNPKSRPTVDVVHSYFINLDPQDSCSSDRGTGAVERAHTTVDLKQISAILHQTRFYALKELILGTMASETRKRSLVSLVGTEAQAMVDFLSELLDKGNNITHRDRTHILHLLSKLAKSAQVFPQCLELKSVDCDLSYPVTEGGYGYIYKATYQGNPVCVKAARIFERNVNRKTLRAHAGELIIWAHLYHSNILPLRGIYLSNEKIQRVCIISPWMENGDLSQYLKDNPDTSREPLLYDVISGLEYLHQLDIVHSDLKAKNVLVSEIKRAMLADFGISRISRTLPTTSTNVTAGTANWMAPELLLHEKPSPTRESDVWAFGCLCYEAVTGLIPFHQFDTVPQLIYAFIKGGVIPLKPTPTAEWKEPQENIWLLAKQCWVYDFERRPTSDALKASFTNLVPGDRLLGPELQRTEWDRAAIDYDLAYTVDLLIMHRISMPPLRCSGNHRV
ncbi:Serine/threonine-protein kinase HT1 [Leucoagaricus sp. SymC.cos]|nr:Serine/threonine-protein kinase HT1 [Leucoagaricus sp. SymC.cos]